MKIYLKGGEEQEADLIDFMDDGVHIMLTKYVEPVDENDDGEIVWTEKINEVYMIEGQNENPKEDIYVVSRKHYGDDDNCGCSFEPIIAFKSLEEAKEYEKKDEEYYYDVIKLKGETNGKEENES